MTPRIDHEFLDHYERVAGELERLPGGHGVDPELWEALDALLLDLHLIQHGYAEDGYSRHVERELARLCTDGSVVERVRKLKL